MATHVYGSFPMKMLNKEIDFLDDDIRIALVTSSYTPDYDLDDYWSDVSTYEYTNAGGYYGAGGLPLVDKEIAYDAASNKIKIMAHDAVWCPAGSSNFPFTGIQYAILYDNTPATDKPLIACIDFGQSAFANGPAFTVKLGKHYEGYIEHRFNLLDNYDRCIYKFNTSSLELTNRIYDESFYYGRNTMTHLLQDSEYLYICSIDWDYNTVCDWEIFKVRKSDGVVVDYLLDTTHTDYNYIYGALLQDGYIYLMYQDSAHKFDTATVTLQASNNDLWTGLSHSDDAYFYGFNSTYFYISGNYYLEKNLYRYSLSDLSRVDYITDTDYFDGVYADDDYVYVAMYTDHTIRKYTADLQTLVTTSEAVSTSAPVLITSSPDLDYIIARGSTTKRLRKSDLAVLETEAWTFYNNIAFLWGEILVGRGTTSLAMMHSQKFDMFAANFINEAARIYAVSDKATLVYDDTHAIEIVID